MTDSDCMQQSISNTSLGFLPSCVMYRSYTPTAINENVMD